ncbi:MAG: YebC/PmpR family DNA-binding transcriptional regulator [Bacteroidota bacterium]
MGRAFEYRKATKFARWDRMAKAFTKAGREITIAVKEGGPDPDYNSKLRRAVQNAKSVQMPKDRIEAAIKKASSKDAEDFAEITYEGMAPHGIAVVVETATDNPTRTVAHVRSIFRKGGGSLGTQGMHDFIFDRKGVFTVPIENIEDEDEFELEFIDHGLSRLEKDDEGKNYRIYVNFQDFGNMQSALEKHKIEVDKSELERIPSHEKELGEEEMDEVLELIDKLEQDDDVQSVFHNLA